jgi:hypothetical protein
MESSLLACSSLDPRGARKVSWQEETETGKSSSLAFVVPMLPNGRAMVLADNRAWGKPFVRQDTGIRDGVAKFSVDSEQKLVTVRFGKTVTAGDIERYAAQLRDSPSFRSGFSEIADLRDVEKLDLKAEDFIRLADQVDPFSLASRRAFVVRNSVQAHAARMHKILRTQRSFEIFHSLEEAEQWISCPESAAPPMLGAKSSRRLR